jgi:hypothetical protein
MPAVQDHLGMPGQTQHQFDELDAAECLRLLASSLVGRLGFTERALPSILPVFFTLRAGDVIMSCLPGSKVKSASRGDIVAFEADGFDAETREGWCVNVLGPSRLITEADQVAALGQLDFAPWTDNQDRQYIALRIEALSGRRVTRQPVAPAAPAGGTR